MVKVVDISEDDFIALSERDESHFFDVKDIEVSGKSVQKIAVAFANADGGEFLVGIRDKSTSVDPAARWAGYPDQEAANGLLQSIFEVQPAIDVRYEFLRRETAQTLVLRVQVEKGAEVCQTSDKTVYIRHGAQSLPVKEPQRIAQLSFAKGATSFEDTIVPDVEPEEIVESDEMERFLREVAPTTGSLDFAVNQNLVEQKTWKPRVAGVLLFHANPSAVISRKCAVKITRYETQEDDPERDHLAEQRTVEGPSYTLIHEAVSAVGKMMSNVKIWTAKGLQELQYPPEAIWETIVNSIIHRDYSISDDIHVLVFNNRIEIRSPGRLPGYVTVENILDARFSRNSKMVRTLNRYANPPNKDLGEGLNTTFQKMKEFGLKQPSIAEDGNYVVVTLPHSPLATPTEAIMTFLKTSAMVTNRQAREITGIRSENLVKIEFYRLRDEGMIERVPGLDGPKSAWRLTDKGQESAKSS